MDRVPKPTHYEPPRVRTYPQGTKGVSSSRGIRKSHRFMSHPIDLLELMIIQYNNDIIHLERRQQLQQLLSGHIGYLRPPDRGFRSGQAGFLLEYQVKILPLILVRQLFLFCLSNERYRFRCRRLLVLFPGLLYVSTIAFANAHPYEGGFPTFFMS